MREWIPFVLVLAILGIVSAIAVPRFANSLARYRVGAAAHRIKIDLEYAQARALQSSASLIVSFHPGTEEYEISGVNALDNASQPYSVRLADGPYHADLVSTSFGGDDQVVFDGFGKPDTGGTALLKVGAVETQVVLDADTGKASVQ